MNTQAQSIWNIDPSHSHVQFKVRHLMISTVTGALNKFSATVQADDDSFQNAKVHFTAEAASFTTGDQSRDGHLQSMDFFDVANHPQISFESTTFEKTGDNQYRMTGNLEIRGISKEIHLDVEFAGVAKDPWGNTKAGFLIEGKVNRKVWGLNWNAVLEAGGFMLQDEVKIHCEVQLSKG